MGRDSKLVLASASEVRATILGGAGINFDICPSRVDEGIEGNAHQWPDLALALAAEKARAVAAKYPDHLVLGAIKYCHVMASCLTSRAMWMRRAVTSYFCVARRTS